ncbi:uncharacterized protein BDR25DRAFT_100747 [Lindgomyces ingoldianus]|uniref:Uncharacterized protein n=1 Tax=Lindgomyces ingoldianus TaxID=673940 RepID=A0ACB6R7F0_9PLEO|nr:uncharacterized protein BDR25DRAFT_100747 [Lindgomyces ingoldianus]KAF2475198.1 hypothetical protein BDR25DRAFT_100747 [Lindgomyces ingoldianus]
MKEYLRIYRFLLIFLSFYFNLSHALHVPQPTNTQNIASSDGGVSPIPTDPAHLSDAPEGQQDLKRLAVRQLGVSTCGYINKISASSLTCPSGYECAINEIYEAAGCCSSGNFDNCYLATACFPYRSMAYCDAACMMDLAVMKCGNLQAAYCLTKEYIYPAGSYTEYNCFTASAYITVWGSYTDGVDGTSFVVPPAVTVTATALPASGTGNGGGNTNQNTNNNNILISMPGGNGGGSGSDHQRPGFWLGLCSFLLALV